ncbi:MAG: class I SAM-dependent methyltransferase [Clostridiales bacterium]|nr:class I SAM-dependent methyltransferase [Clostridiales bacterium]
MKLSKRLETIIDMVPGGEPGMCVADVGTDHGFVPIRLIQLGKAERAIAMDVREGPLQRAKAHIRQYGLSMCIETRLSDGLAALWPGEAGTVVITGMGGELMLRILGDGRRHISGDGGRVRHWILSPQSELGEFRHGLERLGLAVVKETMLVEDGKFYVVMLVEPGAMHYENEYEYRFGALLIRDRSPVLAQLLAREREQYQLIASRLKREEGAAAIARLEEVQNQVEEIEVILHEMQ